MFPQVREDVRISRKEKIENLPGVTKAIQSAESQLAGRGRVFVRFSGTEPLCRILVEGESDSKIRTIASALAAEVRSALG